MSSARSSSKKPAGPYRKPRADVYTVLLVIALIALLLGILCLYLEMDMYEWKIKGGPTVSADRPAAVAMASDQGPGAGDRQCTLRPRSAWLPPPHRNC